MGPSLPASNSRIPKDDHTKSTTDDPRGVAIELSQTRLNTFMDFSILNNQQRDLLNEVNALLILLSISYLLLLRLQSVGSGIYT